jgi:hypothetical protein
VDRGRWTTVAENLKGRKRAKGMTKPLDKDKHDYLCHDMPASPPSGVLIMQCLEQDTHKLYQVQTSHKIFVRNPMHSPYYLVDRPRIFSLIWKPCLQILTKPCSAIGLQPTSTGPNLQPHLLYSHRNSLFVESGLYITR